MKAGSMPDCNERRPGYGTQKSAWVNASSYSANRTALEMAAFTQHPPDPCPFLILSSAARCGSRSCPQNDRSEFGKRSRDPAPRIAQLLPVVRHGLAPRQQCARRRLVTPPTQVRFLPAHHDPIDQRKRPDHLPNRRPASGIISCLRFLGSVAEGFLVRVRPLNLVAQLDRREAVPLCARSPLGNCSPDPSDNHACRSPAPRSW